MKRTISTLAVLVSGLFVAGPAPTPEILYFGKVPGQEAQGMIRLHGQYFAVVEGDEIPGAGTIGKITDDVLIVLRALTEQEQRQLRSRGQAAHDVEERHIVNVSRYLVPRPAR